ncbi:MAG: L-threonylcarbamoyladenylate synthase [Planctomycetota bacterium]|nr:L-threonylcarbamoyladenylate synthase [Planctomycetota bacterium]MDI6787772.1 L-threonylcarbamoyladenylate synthase [Planctomycetota bacterium]
MGVEVIKIDPIEIGSEYLKLLEKPARVLAEGGLVAFPTETVYGLGVNANIPSAVKRFYQVKNSQEHRPFTFHLSSSEEVYYHNLIVPRLAIRLMKAFWPGPLTLVLPLSPPPTALDDEQKWVGLRVPDHIVARDLIRLSSRYGGVAVIASSANVDTEAPPLDAETVLGTLGDKIDIIIDSGHSKIGLSSTVAKITTENNYEILRQGSVSDDNIRRFTYKMIIFVCSGNTCRSPMADGLFKKLLSDKLKTSISELESKGYKIISGGTSAIYDSPASKSAVEVMKTMGVNISDHLSQPITLSMLEEADEVYVMTRGHQTTLKEWVPQIAERIKLLSLDGTDIEDPMSGNKEVYQSCVNKILKGLEQIIPAS